jgi:hypothetical protein
MKGMLLFGNFGGRGMKVQLIDSGTARQVIDRMGSSGSPSASPNTCFAGLILQKN